MILYLRWHYHSQPFIRVTSRLKNLRIASRFLMAREWTSEKEINFFLQSGISNRITQTLSNGCLENYIPFVQGGGFGVSGSIRPALSDFKSDDYEEQELLLLSCRTEFQFTNAKLDLGKWGIYNFPPVGRGWFDTIYLDDGMFAVILSCLKFVHSKLLRFRLSYTSHFSSSCLSWLVLPRLKIRAKG